MNKHVEDRDLPKMPKVEKGVYRHYKGKLYRVDGVCLHTETLEPLVVYTPLYESTVNYWVRPYAMFTEMVDIDGEQVPRFQKIEDSLK